MNHSASQTSPLLTLKVVLTSYLGLLVGYWVYTGFSTSELVNWVAESSLFLSVVISLFAFYRHFRFSMAAYTCFFLYLLLHLHGAHHTYPEAPAGAWLQQQFQLTRNPYDRLVHFFFGLLLVLPMLELAEGPLKLPKHMRWWWPLELVLALSVIYELLEWWIAAVLFPDLGKSYLGYQGDEWDAQKDVALTLSGGIIGLALIRYFKK